MNRGIIIGIIGGVVAVAGIAMAHQHKKYVTMEGEKKEESPIVKKVHSGMKKAIDFVITHLDEIEAVSTMIGLATGIVALHNEFTVQNDHKILKKILENQNRHDYNTWNEYWDILEGKSSCNLTRMEGNGGAA